MSKADIYGIAGILVAIGGYLIGHALIQRAAELEDAE